MRTQKVKKSLWDRMEDLVIGGDLLPADLSSNKAHLKDYGKKTVRRTRGRGKRLFDGGQPKCR